METYITWYKLLLKAHIKRKYCWIQLVIMLFLYMIISNIQLPKSENIQVGFYIQDSHYGERVIVELINKNSVFDFKKYDNIEQLNKKVLSGQLEGGFIFHENFDEKLKNQKMKSAITYVSTPLATKGWAIQETIYSALFRIYSEEILKQGEFETYEDNNEVRSRELLERNQFYLNGEEVFHVDIKEVEVSQEVLPEVEDFSKEKDQRLPVQGLIGMFVFLTMFLAYGRKFETEKGSVESGLNVRERRIFSYLYGLAAGTLPAVIGYFLLLLHPASRGGVKELLSLILLLVMGELWIVLIVRGLKNETSFVSTISTIVAVQLIICPIFINLASYIPAITYVRFLFPLGIYLYL